MIDMGMGNQNLLNRNLGSLRRLQNSLKIAARVYHGGFTRFFTAQ
jgi:hypothetical protein